MAEILPCKRPKPVGAPRVTIRWARRLLAKYKAAELRAGARRDEDVLLNYAGLWEALRERASGVERT